MDTRIIDEVVRITKDLRDIERDIQDAERSARGTHSESSRKLYLEKAAMAKESYERKLQLLKLLKE